MFEELKSSGRLDIEHESRVNGKQGSRGREPKTVRESLCTLAEMKNVVRKVDENGDMKAKHSQS